jgi:hypothetical protein
MDRKAIQMSYMKRTEVCMEGVIEKSIICGEIHGVPLLARRLGLDSRGSFAGRFGLFEREGERSLWIRWGVVGSEVQAICDFKGSERLPDSVKFILDETTCRTPRTFSRQFGSKQKHEPWIYSITWPGPPIYPDIVLFRWQTLESS